MNLNASFKKLYAAVKRIGAHIVDFEIDSDMKPPKPIAIDLEKGLEISLDGVDCENGLLSVQGHQVLLYIQDQGGKIKKAISNGAEGNKYHVADCTTLKYLRENNSLTLYVVTNDLSPDFFISGKDWRTGKEMDGKAQLKVCRNCLMKLNYQDYNSDRRKNKVFYAFNLEVFFSTYSSFFPYPPARFAGPANQDNYTDDWSNISKQYSDSQNFVCEGCGLDLSGHQKLLHAHHINGVKTDNLDSNLKALCVVCHSTPQPCHGHMFVSHKDRQIITRLRREQKKLGANSWDEVIAIADPGVKDLACMCKQNNLPVPKVNPEIRGADHSVIAELELAWPNDEVGIAINMKNMDRAQSKGWIIWDVVKALDKFEIFSGQISRY